MGRKPCCAKEGLNRGAWTSHEDEILVSYIKDHGEGKWRSLPKRAGLKRCGKSCRLRWLNYLRPGIKRGNISDAEEELIIRLHNLLGNRWSLIAGRLPGRTDNEIKNYWNTTLGKKVNAGAHPAKPTTAEAAELIQTKAQRCTRSFFPRELLQPPSSELVSAASFKEAGCLSGDGLQFGGGGEEDGLFLDGLPTEDWMESAGCFQINGEFSLTSPGDSLLIGVEEEWLSWELDF